MAELRGDSIAMEDMIVQLDSLPVLSQPVEEPVAEVAKEEKK